MAGQANHPGHSTGQSTKKIIVNFLLSKNLTIDFMKQVWKGLGCGEGKNLSSKGFHLPAIKIFQDYYDSE